MISRSLYRAAPAFQKACPHHAAARRPLRQAPPPRISRDRLGNSPARPGFGLATAIAVGVLAIVAVPLLVVGMLVPTRFKPVVFRTGVYAVIPGLLTFSAACTVGLFAGFSAGFIAGVAGFVGGIILAQKISKKWWPRPWDPIRAEIAWPTEGGPQAKTQYREIPSFGKKPSRAAMALRALWYAAVSATSGGAAGDLYFRPSDSPYRLNSSDWFDPQRPHGIFGAALKFEKADQRLSNAEVANLQINKPCFSLPMSQGNINYIRAGNPDGQTILLMPGVPTHIYDFHRLIQALSAKGYDVVAVDPPGVGWSTYNAANYDFTYNDNAAFWCGVVHRLGLKDVTAVAYSWAMPELSHTLLTYGKDVPSIKRIVSLSGYAPGIVRGHQSNDPIEDLLTNRYIGPSATRAFAGLPFGMTPEQTYEEMFTGVMPQHELDQIAGEWAKVWRRDNHLGLFMSAQTTAGINNRWRAHRETMDHSNRYYQMMTPYRATANLAGMPTLVLAGEQDTVIRTDTETAVQYGERLAEGLRVLTHAPNATNFRALKTGHGAVLEEAPQIADAIDGFIQNN